MNQTPPAPLAKPSGGRKSFGVLVMVGALLALLVMAGFFAYQGLVAAGDVDVPVQGYIAMGLGIAFSLVIGIGLMALVFYSSRKGYDEPVLGLGREAGNEDDAGGSRPDDRH